MESIELLENFITECKKSTHYEHMRSHDNKFENWKQDNKVMNDYAKWIMHESNIPSLKLNIHTQGNDYRSRKFTMFVKHRGSYNPIESTAVHGQGADKTQPKDYYIKNGTYTEENCPPYDWTEIADQCPVTVDWLKNVSSHLENTPDVDTCC